MCRILLALGNVQLPVLFTAIKQMALDRTTVHERNEKAGLGTWIHQDGWGLAIIKDNHFQLTKSTKPIFDDPKAEEIAKTSTNFALLHVRLVGKGRVCLENTHPFYYKTKSGEEIVFCHNGTIKEEIKFDQKYQPQGETDTEQLFYAILTKYEETKNFSSAITATFSSLLQPWDSNIILSTKTISYVFSQSIKYPRYLQMWIGKKKDSLIVCSEKIATMKDYSWEKLPKGKIVVIDHQTLTILIPP